MNEISKNYLLELSHNSKTRNILNFADEVDEFSILIGKLVETLKTYHINNPIADDDPKQIAFALMTKGANSLMAGFELALTGYLSEPSIVIRSALEGFCTAWDVVLNEKRYLEWKNSKKFSSTDSITNLKKEFEPIGKLYGFLSNMHVHTNPTNSSPPMFSSDEEPEFQLFGYIPPGKEYVRKSEVYIALLSVYVCLQLTEIVFHKYSLEPETIVKKKGVDLVEAKVSERHRRFYDEAIKHFTIQKLDPSICM